MTHTTQTTVLYVGIDVSKETLAVATYPTTTVQVIPNAVDAQMLARFARCYPVPDTPDLPAVHAQLKELWARREQLVQALEAEKTRLRMRGCWVVGRRRRWRCVRWRTGCWWC
jgi:transposase